MKQRTYCITTGDYDNYKIVAFMQGPATPALSTLKKRWEAEYAPYTSVSAVPKATEIMAGVQAEMAAERRMWEDGYVGDNLGELFVSWLGHNYGFTEADVTECHV